MNARKNDEEFRRGESPKHFVSVIIPAWNAASTIRSTLEALKTQSAPRDLFEVIVVDNGSGDDTCEIVREYEWVILLTEPDAGSYRARNKGISFANGDVFAFTDADCRPSISWVEEGLKAIYREDCCALIAGHIDVVPAKIGKIQISDLYEQLFSFNQANSVKVGVCATANWFVCRSVLEDVGVFRGDLKSGGDGELARRILSHGYKVVYDPDVVVGHPARGGFSELAQKRKRVVGGKYQAADRHKTLRATRFALSYPRFEVRTICSSAGLNWITKIYLLALSFALTSVGMFEILRLIAGRSPRRS